MSNEFVMVPRELTPEMREAFHSSYEAYEDGRGECPDSQWRAMLRAAPKTASAEPSAPKSSDNLTWPDTVKIQMTAEEMERIGMKEPAAPKSEGVDLPNIVINDDEPMPVIAYDSCIFIGRNADGSEPFTFEEGEDGFTRLVRINFRGWKCYGPMQDAPSAPVEIDERGLCGHDENWEFKVHPKCMLCAGTGLVQKELFPERAGLPCDGIPF